MFFTQKKCVLAGTSVQNPRLNKRTLGGYTPIQHIGDFDGASVRAYIIPIQGIIELPNNAATDERGHFTLKGIPASEESEKLVIIGEHKNLYGRATWSRQQVEVVAITLAPRPKAVIVSQVIDERDSPIAHAGIGLSWEEGFGGTATTAPDSPIAETDSGGNFTVGPTFTFGTTWLEVGGAYQIHATAAGYGRVSSEWFTLQEGDHKVPVLVLPKAEHFIAGQVVDWQGKPIGATRIVAQGPNTAVNAISDSEGNFRLENIADTAAFVFTRSEKVLSRIRRNSRRIEMTCV